MRIQYICEQCPVVFLVHPYEAKSGKRRFCSVKCRVIGLRGPRTNPIDRFWAKVDKNGPISPYCPELGPCWIWTAGKTTAGYGIFHPNGTDSIFAHRYAFALARGPIAPGIEIRHRCHVPACVRHLTDGTHADNMRDMVESGRAATGDRHGTRTKPESRPTGDRHWIRRKKQAHA